MRIICKLLLFILMGMPALFAVAQTGTASAKRPNIVVFLTDDPGYGDLGCYGNPIIKTPNFDRFAREGALLTDCHSGGTVCSPSRAALLTGRKPYRMGFYYIVGGNTYLRSKELTMAELLKQYDYATCFVGKWHLSVLEKRKISQPGPTEQGFDYWMGTSHNPFDGPANTKAFIRNGEPVGQVQQWFCDVIVDEAGNWLKEKRDTTKPFFLYVASHEPHTPVAPPKQYSDMYDTPQVDSLEKSIAYGRVSRPAKDISANKKFYYGTVTQLDHAFGRLMHTLDSLGLRENTIVFVTSDNGPENPVTSEESLDKWNEPIRDNCFGSPGIYRGVKRFVYEGGHRVPGMVRFPGVIPAGTTSDKLFDGTDLMPTIAALVGVKLPDTIHYDGVSNFNAFLNKPVKRETPAVWCYPNHEDTYFRMPVMELREGDYALVGWLPPKPDNMKIDDWFFANDPVRFELYNLKKDPSQVKDIASQQTARVKMLSKKMIANWREMRDEGKNTLSKN
jgi:arylsulfatase A